MPHILRLMLQTTPELGFLTFSQFLSPTTTSVASSSISSLRLLRPFLKNNFPPHNHASRFASLVPNSAPAFRSIKLTTILSSCSQSLFGNSFMSSCIASNVNMCKEMWRYMHCNILHPIFTCKAMKICSFHKLLNGTYITSLIYIRNRSSLGWNFHLFLCVCF